MLPFAKPIRLPKFVADVISLLSSRLALLVMGIATSVILARLLGPEKRGIITVAEVVPGLVLSFADLGLRQSTTYFMGKRLYPDQAIISSVILMMLATTMLALAGALVFSLVSGYPLRYGWLVTLIPMGNIPLALVTSYSNGVLLAKRRIGEVAALPVLAQLATLIAVGALFVLRIDQVEPILWIDVLTNVIPAGYILWIIKRYGALKPAYIPPLPWEMLKKGIIYAAALFIMGLNYRFDVVVLERMTNSREVGVYTVGVNFANLLWMLPNAMTMVLFSRSAAAKDSLQHARDTAQLLRLTLWGASLPLALLYVLAPYVIPWLYTAQFGRSPAVVQAILPGVWAMLVFKILQSDLAGRGRPGAGLWVFILALVVNTGLNVWWDPMYGAVGSAWASTVSYGLVAVLFGMVYARMSNLRLSTLLLPTPSDFKRLLPARAQEHAA